MSGGRRVLVTGGTGALGTSVVRRFLANGDDVTVPWILEEEADRTRDELAGLGGLQLVRGDLARSEDVARMVDETGPFDVLVHLVGMWRGGVPVHETDDATWDLVMDVNLRTAFNCARAVLPDMRERRWGRLVFVSSRTAHRGQSGQVAYAVSKAAVAALTEAIADETRGTGVTANAVSPSIIDTPANRRSFPDSDHGSWVTPEQLAATISFLASDAGAAITGATLPVPGGV